jgi:apolipoprotein N-acyltransferase
VIARISFLGVLAGVSIGLAGSPIELTLAAFASPGLLLLALEGSNAESVSPRIAFATGALCGVSCHAITMSWVVELLATFAGFPAYLAWPVAALLWLVQSLPMALGAWLAVPLMRRGMPGWLALPLCLTLSGSLTPMLFPWRLGVSQMPSLHFVQLADIGGPPLLELLLSLGSCAAIEALRHRNMHALVVAFCAIGAPHLYGALRIEDVRGLRASMPSLHVGVVQPNIGIFEKHDPILREPHLRLHREMTRTLEAQGADLVLWPESSFPFAMERPVLEDSHAEHRRIMTGGVRGPLLFGALTHQGTQHFNSVIGMAASGLVTGTYDKVHLLAFGEFVPLYDFLPGIERYVPRGFTPGTTASAISIAGVRVGVLNCYEDLLPEHTRLIAAENPGFLANFTNDAWFGNTFAPHLHHMLARQRAIETRRDLVRAVNTGISGIVLATGEDSHRTHPDERTSFVGEVRILEGVQTPWTRFGDRTTPALLGFFFAWSFATRKRRDTLRSDPSPRDG